MEKETIEVYKCAECPFYEYQDEMMDSTCRADHNLYYGDFRKAHKIVTNGTHDNCPLKNRNIEVKLGE